MAGKQRKTINIRVNESTPAAINAEAAKNGFLYGGYGSTGKLLDAIACGEFVVVGRSLWEKLNDKTT